MGITFARMAQRPFSPQISRSNCLQFRGTKEAIDTSPGSKTSGGGAGLCGWGLLSSLHLPTPTQRRRREGEDSPLQPQHPSWGPGLSPLPSSVLPPAPWVCGVRCATERGGASQ